MLVAAVLALLLVGALIATAAPAVPGEKTGETLDLVLLIDNSNSMVETQTMRLGPTGPYTTYPPSDRDAIRIRMAQYIASYLRVDSEAAGVEHQLGVVSFGGQVGQVVTLTSALNPSLPGRIRVEKLDYTDFVAPLENAKRQLENSRADKRAIILLTDGHPANIKGQIPTDEQLAEYFRPDRTEKTSLAQQIHELRAAGVEIYVVAIGQAPLDEKYWTEDSGFVDGDKYFPLSGPRQLPEVYMRVIGKLLDHVGCEQGEIGPNGSALVAVNPYLERVTLSFVKGDKRTTVAFTGPGEKGDAKPPLGQNDYSEIYSLREPRHGEWRVQVRGASTVTWSMHCMLSTLRVDADSSTAEAGSPITLTARLIRNGQIVHDPLRMRLVVFGPDEFHLERGFTSNENGLQRIRLPFDITGTYTITARIDTPAGALDVRHEDSQFQIVAPPPDKLVPTNYPSASSTPNTSPSAMAPTLGPIATPVPSTSSPTPAESIVLPVITNTPSIHPPVDGTPSPILPGGLLGTPAGSTPIPEPPPAPPKPKRASAGTWGLMAGGAVLIIFVFFLLMVLFYPRGPVRRRLQLLRRHVWPLLKAAFGPRPKDSAELEQRIEELRRRAEAFIGFYYSLWYTTLYGRRETEKDRDALDMKLLQDLEKHPELRQGILHALRWRLDQQADDNKSRADMLLLTKLRSNGISAEDLVFLGSARSNE